MTEKVKSTIAYIILIIILLTIGFFIGRSTVEIRETIETKYIKGDTIIDTLYYPKTVKVNTPIDTLNIIKQCIKDGIYQELWPEKIITEYIIKEDSIKIINDWASERIYNELLFNNDSLGFCEIKTSIQYNRLKYMTYIYNPIIKEVTETKEIVKTFSPFIGGGFASNPWDTSRNPKVIINGGMFIKEKYGIQLYLMHSMKTKEDHIGVSFLWKF